MQSHGLWGLSGHSNNSLGVSQAAMLHACAATPELASNLTDIPAGTLTFNVTANYQDGSNNSISEVIDNLVDYDHNGRTFEDHLSLAVFKLRKSIYANEAFKLDNTLTDGQVGSINTFRKQLNPNGGSDISVYIENKIAPSSTFSKPEINRNVVVLPQPLGPNKDTILPFSTEKEI